MKIKIKKLFGKYDTEVDLNRRCTVFIGENGIGKSTTLNIIDCILKQDYYNLLKYKFESIEIEKHEFYYKEIAPNIMELKNSLNNIFKRSDKNEFNEFDAIKIIENIKEDIEDEYYRSFISSIINDKYSTREKTMIKSLLVYSGYTEKNDFNKFCSYIRRAIKYASGKKKYIFNDLILEYKNKSFKLDMTKHKSIINTNEKLLTNRYDKATTKENKLFINDKLDKEKTWFIFYENNKKNIFPSKMYKEQIDEKAKKHFIEYVNSKNDMNLYINFSNTYEKIREEQYVKDTMNSFMNLTKSENIEKILDSNRINVSKLLLSLFYEKEYIEKIIRKYYRFIKEYKINNNKNKKDIVYDEQISFDIENYIQPLLPKDSLFDYYRFHSQTEENIIYEFYQEISNDIQRYSNNIKINRLEEVLNKYFKSKRIKITPTKICISKNSKYYERENIYNELDYEFLSEGEKKIIIIFLVSILFDDIVLLIDEPETSLSIVWQETLLNDLLKETNLKNIIVATQSPHMVIDEMFNEMITPIMEQED